MKYWLHRRAVLAFVLLPWVAVGLALLGLITVDIFWGDAVARQNWAQEPHWDLARAVVADLPLVLLGAYVLGMLPWLGGLLLGDRPAGRSALWLGGLCGMGGIGLAGLAGVTPWEPSAWMLAVVASTVGVLYAMLTHRTAPRVLRRRHRPLHVPQPRLSELDSRVTEAPPLDEAKFAALGRQYRGPHTRADMNTTVPAEPI